MIAHCTPRWPAPPAVHALMTLRGEGARDGASRGRWRYCNLGDHVGDDAAAVASNRERLQRQLRARPVFLRQVHADGAVRLDGSSADGAQADVAWTRARTLACTVLVADCLPVLLARGDGTAVAAVHVGWRGLAAGAIEQGVAHVACGEDECEDLPRAARAAGVMAWLGPCIGPAAFEVGEDVHAALGTSAAARRHFRRAGAGRYLASLPALARERLAHCGVVQVAGNDGHRSWCTVSNPALYFSHRRDRTGSGRMAACIWIG